MEASFQLTSGKVVQWLYPADRKTVTTRHLVPGPGLPGRCACSAAVAGGGRPSLSPSRAGLHGLCRRDSRCLVVFDSGWEKGPGSRQGHLTRGPSSIDGTPGPAQRQSKTRWGCPCSELHRFTAQRASLNRGHRRAQSFCQHRGVLGGRRK